MKPAAAIAAQLVDIRNVGLHKSLKFTLHVPEEEALKAIEAFGWPTGANPVAVAIARLDLSKPGATRTRNAPAREAASDPGEPDTPASRPHRPWDELSLAEQAGIACTDPKFRRYLFESACVRDDSEDAAAAAVRLTCGVRSRGDIRPGTEAAALWDQLYSAYQMWLRYPELAES
jgi:hypothetical protein